VKGSLLVACLIAALVAPPAAMGQSGYEASSGVIRPGGFVLFLTASGPLSYATLTPGHLPHDALRLGPISGRGCQFAISTPMITIAGIPRLSAGAGGGGFEKALQNIRERYPDLQGIYDVKIDVHMVAVLTVFQRLCTQITAQGFRIILHD
jgi:hypothetical protein